MQIKRGGGGFTLAELLIVMAIIVVLAAVAIPTFGRQLETARETGDMEIIRAAYTEALSMAVLDASDGLLDGKNGGTEFKGYADGTIAGSADGNIKEVVSYVVASDKPVSNVSDTTNYSSVVYKVVLPLMDEKSAIQQTGYNWQYVNRYIVGAPVPSVVRSEIGTDGKIVTTAAAKGTWWVSFEFILPKATDTNANANVNVRLATDGQLTSGKRAINVNTVSGITSVWS